MSAETTSGPDLLDVETFSARVLGRPLWRHQLDVARSSARYRVICAGRQVGKSVLLAACALHTAATRRNATVLIISAGEDAAKRLLADVADLATSSAALRGSVLDETRSSVTLSNGSVIRSVPASQRQVRGWAVDLLIVDEAGFIDQDLWRAAEPAIIARPGSRVILASSPWGTPEHFFRALWNRGRSSPDEQVRSWHWPSSVSPLVDDALLAQIREREAPDYFAREFLAEWPDASGSYFSERELMAAVADTDMVAPESIHLDRRCDWLAVGGLDWGVARDANALVLATVTDPDQAPDARWRVALPWIEAHHHMPWATWIERLVEVCGRYRVEVLASETNGVGAYPTEDLQGRAWRQHRARVLPVWTDVRRKMSGFGKIKALLQADRLVLPRHPDLLRQLAALQFEQLAGGNLRIAVPEAAGHDDLAMAAMQALSCVEVRLLRDTAGHQRRHRIDADLVTTGAGVQVPRRPTPWQRRGWINRPKGQETGDGW
ncbi:terminase large subunit domain-containing protein [Pseudonocardia sp. RS010]|uniref:terminase large subunit domain-containing protein n=1 Tax=Pseudonocardia sp. RS010 TaxID=3385979 RepID=UPI0039A22F57